MDWKEFFKAHWVKFAFVLLPIIGGVFGWSIKVNQVPADQPPSIVINVPGEPPEPLVFEGVPADGKGFHPLYNACRRIAGRQYAREQGLEARAGVTMAFGVPDANITAAAAAVGYADIPVSQGKLADWLKAHPDAVKLIIEIIKMLIPLLVAEGQPPAIRGPGVGVCAVFSESVIDGWRPPNARHNR